MTDHAAYSSENVDAAVAAPEPAGRDLTSSRPLKLARLDCKKHAAAVDLSASGAVGSSCSESTKASSLRHAADAELHGDRMEKRPSALAEFESLLAAAKGKQIVMFLDYDGTLSPILEDPDSAVMSEEMREAVRRVAEHFPTAIVSGRCRDKVLEIRPSIDWDKGKALEFLLESLGYAGRNDVFSIYIGDDRTDEDAFKVLRNMGQGIGILVSKLPKETVASYSLSDRAEVMEFLCKLAKSKRGTRQQ